MYHEDPHILFAPEAYWKMSIEQRHELFNGCGAWCTWCVPDVLFGLDISEACRIHDYLYRVGKSIEDKASADRVFLNNMLRLIDYNRPNWLMKRLRQRMAYTYFIAVSRYGGPAFWEGKNPRVTEKPIVAVLAENTISY